MLFTLEKWVRCSRNAWVGPGNRELWPTGTYPHKIITAAFSRMLVCLHQTQTAWHLPQPYPIWNGILICLSVQTVSRHKHMLTLTPLPSALWHMLASPRFLSTADESYRVGWKLRFFYSSKSLCSTAVCRLMLSGRWYFFLLYLATFFCYFTCADFPFTFQCEINFQNTETDEISIWILCIRD